jgi:hypothetical protein
MSSQLLPSTNLAPSDLSELPIAQRASVWLEMLDAGYKLVMAGLARDNGPSGDLSAAYRRWYAEQMIEHDLAIAQMLNRMQERQ